MHDCYNVVAYGGTSLQLDHSKLFIVCFTSTHMLHTYCCMHEENSLAHLQEALLGFCPGRHTLQNDSPHTQPGLEQ